MRSFLVLFFHLISTSVFVQTTVTMGNANVETGIDNGNGNILLAQQASLTTAGTLNTLSFYVTTAAGSLVLGVYDNTGPSGGPGKLLASTASFTPVTGWNTQNVTTKPNLAAGTYWLARLPSSSTLAYRARSSANCSYKSQSFGNLPATFPTGLSSCTPTTWSFYGTLTAAPTPPRPTVSAPSNTAPPSASVQPVEGSVLTATAGKWTGAIGSYSHQWHSGNTLLSSTHDSTLQHSDVGNTLSVTVTATGLGGSTSAVSPPIGLVLAAGATTPPTEPPVVPPSGDVQAPGPSPALFANHYYTCTTNRYVSATGRDSNDGMTQATAWATLRHADSLAAAGWCINIADGVYNQATFLPKHSGTAATATGYIVYRCISMNGCILNAGSGAIGIDVEGPSYLQFDGLDIQGPPDGAANTVGFNVGQRAATRSHHIWLLNSKVHGFTMSGLQLNGRDFMYVFHNEIYWNSRNSCYAGSGYSAWHVTALSPYTLTADDHVNPNAANLGIPSFDTGNGQTFRWVTGYNHVHNNAQSNTNCSGTQTDGNGFIWDDNTSQSYSGAHLYAYNVSYTNGGSCLHIFGSQNAWVANNSLYNCSIDPNNKGTWRPTLDDSNGSTSAFPSRFYNNIAVSINGSGIMANNSSLLIASPYFDGNAGNITYKIGGGSEIDFQNGASSSLYSSTANKKATDPKWADVGRSSTGSMNVAPVGHNFALCTATGVPNAACTGASPAIGYGTKQPYLPETSVDAGACPHQLTTCP
jgi:hypothetical protein